MDGLERVADLMWAAGVIDAAASFRLEERPSGRTRLPRITYMPTTRRTQVVAELHRIMGGEAGRPPRNWGVSKRKPLWRVTGATRCLHVVEQVGPYLRHCQGLARLHYAYCQRVVEYKRPSFDLRGIPDEEVDAREAIAVQFLRELLRLQSEASSHPLTAHTVGTTGAPGGGDEPQEDTIIGISRGSGSTQSSSGPAGSSKAVPQPDDVPF